MLWEIDVHPAATYPDVAARRVADEAAALGITGELAVASARGYLLQGPLTDGDVDRLACELFTDAIVERSVRAAVGDDALVNHPHCERWGDLSQHIGDAAVVGPQRAAEKWLVHVLPKPGVMDPVALSAHGAIAAMGIDVEAVRTLRKYWLAGFSCDALQALCDKVLLNETIEQVVLGPLDFARLELGAPYRFDRVTIPLGACDDAALDKLSREGQLFLSLDEMRAIRDHFRTLGRDPTDVELETIAQTWSEHCSHKTLKGRIRYRDADGERMFENMLKQTIFAATQRIREQAGERDFCVSVFEDNAGVIRFDDDYDVVFKVETHNHPSALEPYGGANTGIGGVIRDPMGTGLGARPVCNTDVFCFAPPDTSPDHLPKGVLHPKRIMQGVVAGVRDYGNRMGIPTVNGAVYFDHRYLANPLVYCGNAGLLPRGMTKKQPREGDLIVTVGGRTGRDGIHGATFSSAELTEASEGVSGGAVQIGNAITEKMMLDVLMQARDRGLYRAVTDCGAGGFSSAVGEMGAEIGAVVELERVPLKYAGLSYNEIWISEAQERMVLAVPPACWGELQELCRGEDVEVTAIGRFEASRRLRLRYEGHEVANLAMDFLHDGRPDVVLEATYQPAAEPPLAWPGEPTYDFTLDLLRILGSLNVASKHWVIRQYDHEVQGGSVIKPLVGAHNDGPSDAAVVRPVLASRRGIVLACGMNPRYGDIDTRHMAASAIDEALRNCVAVGADPCRVALLDNFCWADTSRPEVLGSLVRAAVACHDVALELGTPFISGKDSLNNEYRYRDDKGQERSISIPPSLLISAIGQINDVARSVTMDFKRPGNLVYQVGATREELGGSHYTWLRDIDGGRCPRVDPRLARRTFERVHTAMHQGLVRACHDLSEGGLAVAAAEMAIAGGLGVRLFLVEVPHAIELTTDAAEQAERLAARVPDEDFNPLAVLPQAAAVLLFSESNTRFLCEVAPEDKAGFEDALTGVPHAAVGEVIASGQMQVVGLPAPTRPVPDMDEPPQLTAPLVISASLERIKAAWQDPLDWP